MEGKAMDYLDFGVALKRKFGSQVKASAAFGISEVKLSYYVRGRRMPSEEERERFKASLGVDYFAGHVEQPRPAA
jgi:hypothetical protein